MIPCVSAMKLVYHDSMSISSPAIRPPRVSGSFYPSDPEELSKQIQQFLDRAETVSIEGSVHGLIVPHAGYQYSGQVAASGYATLPRTLKRFFIIGALHNRINRPFRFALPGADAFATPLGEVPVSTAADELLKNPVFSEIPEAHDSHIIEVHLPFLQHMFTDFEIIPIVTGSTNMHDIAAAAGAVSPFIDDSTALIVSSDLSHYYPYSEAVKLDEECLDAFVAMDIMRAQHAEACGLPAALILIQTAKTRRWKSSLVQYRNSGDVSGDKTRVVGYGAVAYYEMI